MYTDFFGFSEKPFSVTPDPRFFYTNPSYQEAYASLLYGIHERRGFIVLTGEIGTGKTTLLRRLMANMEARIRIAFFNNTTLGFEDILDCICDEFSIPYKDTSRLQKIQALNQFLANQLAKGGTAVLLIDEAQNLREEVLEDLRLLSNLETTSEKLLQIVMVGQPEFEEKLNLPVLRQLKQRIAIQCRLQRLGEEEVGPFINYRLEAVGYRRHQLFTPEAVQEIAYYSKGFPRLINILCDNALLIAYATSQRRITAHVVQEAAADLRLEVPQEPSLDAEDDWASADDFGPARGPAGLYSAAGFFNPPPARGRYTTLWVVLTILFLGIGGIGFYAWSVDANFLGHLQEQLGSLRQALWGGEAKNRQGLVVRESSKVRDQKFPASPGSPSALDKTEPSSTNDPVDVGQRSDPHPSAPVHSQDVSVANNPTVSPGKGNDATAVSSESSVSGWRERPLVVQPGATIAEIAANSYGMQRNLGLDLIKEYNTHIENLNRIWAGQRLWLPPLSRETLVRQQPDGSFSLILASFRIPQQAEQLAQVARLRGYVIVVTPRRVSDNLMLYRVEISGLENLPAVSQAWETATSNQWLAASEDGGGGAL